MAAPDFAAVHQELKVKGMTKLLLWEEYREANPDDGYSYPQFCHRYSVWLGKQKRSMRQVHVAGQKCFVDYAGTTVPIVNANTGQIEHAQIFVAVLGASGYTFAHASKSQTQADWINSHNAAFAFFGGVTDIVVPDCLKAAVAKTDRWEPTITASYQSWAEHYDCAIIPARPRKPKDKSKAELGVLLVTRWILMRLRRHTFFSIAELNEAIAALLPSLNDRAFQRLPGSRHSVFESIERAALKPLPVSTYEYVDIRNAAVHVDYHIEYAHHYYSVPHTLIKTQVEVRASARMVSIYAHGKQVACHPRSHNKWQHTTLLEHMPSEHRFVAEWSVERFESWARDIGDSTLQVVRIVLQKRKVPEQNFRAALALLDLAKTYDRQRLEAACEYALKINSPTRPSIKSILKRGLETMSATVTEDTDAQDDAFLQEHENVRGASTYH